MLVFGPFVRYISESIRDASFIRCIPESADSWSTYNIIASTQVLKRNFTVFPLLRQNLWMSSTLQFSYLKLWRELCRTLLRRLFGACALEVTNPKGRRFFFKDVLNYIDEELGDPQLQRVLEATAQPVIAGKKISGRQWDEFPADNAFIHDRPPHFGF